MARLWDDLKDSSRCGVDLSGPTRKTMCDVDGNAGATQALGSPEDLVCVLDVRQ